jgi:hypothetical protein
MAISVLEMTPSPEQSPSRGLSPAEVEDGYYQPIPSRRWHDVLLDNLTPMALRLRLQPHPHHPFVSHKHRTSITKVEQDYVDKDTRIEHSGPEPLLARRPLPVIEIIKLACIMVPVTILCLLLVNCSGWTLINTDSTYSGILHIVSYFADGHALLAVTDLSFMPDWGQSGKIGDGLAHYPTDATRDVLPIRKCLRDVFTVARKSD